MKYNFDEVIDRTHSNSMNTDGWREYIFHAPRDAKFPYPDDAYVRMWIADMEFATPPCIIDAMKERLDKRIFGYTKVFDPAYFEAFSAWCRNRYEWEIKKEELVTSPGIIPALFELTGYICQPDEKVLILTPSYAYFKHAVDFNHRELVCSDLINTDGYYTMDFADIEKKAADPKVKLCIFCNPHNPSGRIWTEEELQTFGEICLKNNVMIISDEIHCDLIRTGLRHTPLAKLFPDSDQIITCMAPSKTFNMAGLMFSNVLIPHAETMKVWKARHYDFENPLSIAAAQAAYEKGGEWLAELKLYLDDNFRFTKEYLAEHLLEAKFRISEATYLGWVDIGAYVEKGTDLPLLFANEAGVLLEGGDMFVQNSDTYIRLNLACPRAGLAEGLRRICYLLNKKKK
ncbi:putative C-S lyase [Anaerotignum lactatifermentans]|uniref:cysteine-S-conjugate beta-lyase n=1 Tax=Anaerotignum lactatifermentans TaxID=160404 RepID=A0ABS2GAC2_9FIRM|nr:PatB family C-S lyase [Anaerotignum lactatifermentans]MBM6829252.1 putative C-S lyase [Anaerotignum lactatifermentans]MBM6877508.1 putative C-S lyase [Anaerotignum lactatifermentans]MBM6950830.1 putative C-S lyase [Anaerotignum lactatifermentans]